MELFWNSYLVENITEDEKNTTVQVNGDTLAVTHRAKVSGYKQDVWFSKDAITNIFATKILIRQYWVTYDSIDKTFVVQREDQEKPNTE